VIFTFAGLVVALACVWASLRRVKIAVEVSGLDLEALAAAVRKAGPAAGATVWRGLCAEIQELAEGTWERDLVLALGAPGAARVALVNEQLGELDYRSQRWARVPRVCASICSSSGFLLASLAMRTALASDSVDVQEAVAGAINVAAVGIAGASFCVAAHVRSRALVKDRLAAADKLVERIEALAARGAAEGS